MRSAFRLYASDPLRNRFGRARAVRWCSPWQPIFCGSLVAGIPVMLATGRGDGAILIVLTATTAVVSRASRAPAVAQVLFVALLTVASCVMAFGGVGSAALDSAVAHFVLPAAAAPLLLGAALRSGVVAWPRSGRKLLGRADKLASRGRSGVRSSPSAARRTQGSGDRCGVTTPSSSGPASAGGRPGSGAGTRGPPGCSTDATPYRRAVLAPLRR
jgi:hypothetical protein